jgi:hypothetical protein
LLGLLLVWGLLPVFVVLSLGQSLWRWVRNLDFDEIWTTWRGTLIWHRRLTSRRAWARYHWEQDPYRRMFDQMPDEIRDDAA